MKHPVAIAITAVFAALLAAPVFANEAAAKPAPVDLAKGKAISAGVCGACHTDRTMADRDAG